ncbi:hypothetical protein [Nonomuraea sp. 10N515B]|uniref:hypothetical protein n=1 Tax=Nonomuraea sp. 10N515B TaxID=3457422 RepID=UPI003FCDECF8
MGEAGIMIKESTTTPAGSHTACLRNRVGPHPGDAGKGGGVLRVGDCTLIEDGVRLQVERLVPLRRPR